MSIMGRKVPFRGLIVIITCLMLGTLMPVLSRSEVREIHLGCEREPKNGFFVCKIDFLLGPFELVNRLKQLAGPFADYRFEVRIHVLKFAICPT
jgi:hypothetical protein